jgi:hypothetical protein
MLEKVKQYAWQQMDAMWHNHSVFKTTGMVSFEHKGYTVVNPWLDEKTEKAVNPYSYYGKEKTEYFIREVKKRLKNRQ